MTNFSDIPVQTLTLVPESVQMDLSASPPWGEHMPQTLAPGRRSQGYAGQSWHCSVCWPHRSYTSLPTQTLVDLEAFKINTGNNSSKILNDLFENKNSVPNNLQKITTFYCKNISMKGVKTG